MLDGFGTQDSHHLIHGLQWSPAGKLIINQGCSTISDIEADGKKWHLGEGDFFNTWPDGTGFDIIFRSFTNSWGYDWDDYGNWVANDNEGPHLIHLVEGGDYGLSLTRRRAGQPGILPGIAREYGDERGYLVQAGLTIYSGDAFPEEYQGNVLQGAPRLHKVIRDRLEHRGASFLAHLEPDLSATDDEWHRPIAMTVGPDGAVYVIDWYNEILAHVEHPLNSPRRDKSRGRIYRIQWKGAEKKPIPDLGKRDIPALVEGLRSNNKWERRTCQRLLAAKGNAAVDAVLPLLAADESIRTRCHAIWALEETRLAEHASPRRDAIRFAIARALDDEDAEVRAASLRTIRHLRMQDTEVDQQLIELASSDDDDFVRFEAAMTIAALPERLQLEQILSVMAHAEWDDPFLRYAFTRAVGPYQEELVMRAFIEGGRSLSQENSAFIEPLLELRDPRAVPLFLAMLKLPLLKPHIAAAIFEGLQTQESPDVARALVNYLASHPTLPAQLARPILQDLRRRPAPAAGAGLEEVNEMLANLAGENSSLARDVYLTAAHVGDHALAPRIIKDLDNSEPRVAEAAVLAAGDLHLKEAAERMRERAKEAKGRERWSLVRALAKTGEEDCAPLFLEALATPDTSQDALAGLKRLGQDEPALLDKVLERTGKGGIVMNRRMERQLGDWINAAEPDAAKKQEALQLVAGRTGVIRDWKIIGPFPNVETRGHATAYPPELELKDDASYDGLEQKVSWKARHTDDPSGIVGLMDLHPNDHAVAYAWGEFESAVARKATLYCGSDDSIKVWVNGALVHDNLVDRGLSVDQDQAPIALRAGKNTILVKIGQNGGGWNFHARIGTLPAQVENDPDNLETRALYMSGDPGRGEKIFFEGAVGCVRCHSVDGKGGRVGPDLSRVARVNPKTYLIHSILNPSEEIAEGFGGVTLVTNDGEELEGYIHRETPEEIVFVTSDGKTMKLGRSQIAERRTHSSSGMPEDLEETLKPGEFCDLVAYLAERD